MGQYDGLSTFNFVGCGVRGSSVNQFVIMDIHVRWEQTKCQKLRLAGSIQRNFWMMETIEYLKVRSCGARRALAN